jgi:lycopene beta-cyclase
VYQNGGAASADQVGGEPVEALGTLVQRMHPRAAPARMPSQDMLVYNRPINPHPIRVSIMFDVIVVGGGLQSALLTLALQAHRPQTRIAVVEQEARLGGNHTWCFHEKDLDTASGAWIEPLVVARWPSYSVSFRGFQRHVDGGYGAITSERLHQVIRERLTADAAGHEGPGDAAHSSLRLDCRVATIDATSVTLASGEQLRAPLVIDARGPRSARVASEGYQKFVGVEIDTGTPHGWKRPVLMDATVEQFDGFRFLYVLPFSDRRVLLEETFFSDTPDLSIDASRQRILRYLEDAGCTARQIVREEQGVLPMPWEMDVEPPAGSPVAAGYRGGFFHPATGYSLPVAARLADLVGRRSPQKVLTDGSLQKFWQQHRSQVSFCLRLNAMLFQWFAPEDRWHVYQRFYGLPQETIDRFYALQLRPIDQGRLVLGRPPRGFSLRYRLSRGSVS